MTGSCYFQAEWEICTQPIRKFVALIAVEAESPLKGKVCWETEKGMEEKTGIIHQDIAGKSVDSASHNCQFSPNREKSGKTYFKSHKETTS